MSPRSAIPSIERFHARALQLALILIPPIAIGDQLTVIVGGADADPTPVVYAFFWVVAFGLSRRQPANSTPFFSLIVVYLAASVLTTAFLDFDLVGADPTPTLAMLLGFSILTVALSERRVLAQIAAHTVLVGVVAFVAGIEIGLPGDELFIGSVGPAVLTAIAGFLIVSVRNHLTDTLLQLNRAASAQSRLVAVVSHELRTPLTTVTGLAWELAENASHHGDDETGELLGLIASQADDLAVIVEDLLTSARLDAGTLTVEPSYVDLAPEVLTIADELSIQGTLGFQLSGGTATAHADPTRTRQILRNLLTNAIRYGGSNVDVNISSNAGAVEIVVSDDGPTLDPTVAASIFDAYVSASESPPAASVGIGLHVSRQLAKAMGGDLDYDLERSGFRLSLPAAD